MAGRYLEHKKERDALHRDKKIEMYDGFLSKLFALFANEPEKSGVEAELVVFLRESQRKFLLWSGPRVIRRYSEWQKLLKAGSQGAQVVFAMEDFFLALRADLGHSNRGIKRGDTIRFILRNTDLFLEMARKNPTVTLQELATAEKALENTTSAPSGSVSRTKDSTPPSLPTAGPRI